MTYDVSSAFVDETLAYTSSPVRKFTIGSSDYSSRVIKWPKITKEWDRPKPVTVNMDLSNADLGMNFLRLDKTLLTSQCSIALNFGTVVAGIPSNISSLQQHSNYAGVADVRGLMVSPDGTVAFAGSNSKVVRSFYMTTPFDFSTMASSGTLDTSADAEKPYGVVVNSEGSKMYLMDNKTDAFEYYDLSSNWLLGSATNDGLKAFDVTATCANPTGLCISEDGLKGYTIHHLTGIVYGYATDSSWDFSSASHTGTFNPTANIGLAKDLCFINSGSTLFLSGSQDTMASYDVSTPYDLTSTVTFDKLSNALSGNYFQGICATSSIDIFVCDDDNARFSRYLSHATPDSDEDLTVFAGTLDSVAYKKGKCQLRIIDKMKQLSDRLVGSRDVPVTYTNELLSDVAWWLVTSYGGYDLAQSTLNEDIDFDEYNDWAAVMSGDNVRVSAHFEGVKVTECLRKIARISHSAVYIENDKLVFSRFSVTGTPDINIDDSTILDSVLTIRDSTIINKQYVNAGYNVSSRSYSIVVEDEVTASVNSYGIREHVEEDKSLWYVDSNSALNLAQRKTFTQGDPVDDISVTTPLTTITKQLGDIIGYDNPQQNVSENYRIMKRGLDLNTGKITLDIDRSQLVSAFILDVTSLDGSEVLT